MEDSSVTYWIPQTWIFDSIASDTTAGVIPLYADSNYKEARAETLRQDSIANARQYLSVPDDGTDAVMPAIRSGSMQQTIPAFTVLVLLVILAINASTTSIALHHYRTDLTGTRQRENAFDKGGGVPLRSRILLVLLLIASGGIILSGAVCMQPPALLQTGICTALTAAYLTLKYIAYRLVGYSFGTPGQNRIWLNGYLASRAFEGLLLSIIALLMVTSYRWTDTLPDIAVVIFLIFEIIFIIKGFRIFYQGIGSLVYFILYLCTLELIPALILYMSASELCNLLH